MCRELPSLSHSIQTSIGKNCIVFLHRKRGLLHPESLSNPMQLIMWGNCFHWLSVYQYYSGVLNGSGAESPFMLFPLLLQSPASATMHHRVNHIVLYQSALLSVVIGAT